MPVDAVYPWLLTPVLFYCTGGHGCFAHPAFSALLISRAVHFQHLGHFVPRERRVTPPFAVMPRECGAPSTRRPLGLITSVSGILDRPVKPGDDDRESGSLPASSRTSAARSGTHNHRQQFLNRLELQLCVTTKACGYGSPPARGRRRRMSRSLSHHVVQGKRKEDAGLTLSARRPGQAQRDPGPITTGSSF